MTRFFSILGICNDDILNFQIGPLAKLGCFKLTADNFLFYIVTISLASGLIQSLTSWYAKVLHGYKQTLGYKRPQSFAHCVEIRSFLFQSSITLIGMDCLIKCFEHILNKRSEFSSEFCNLLFQSNNSNAHLRSKAV